MRPTVCGWAAPGRPRPKKGLDRLRGEHLSCGDTVSIWEDPLLPFWLLLCAVGTIERQIPEGRLLREIGVRRTYREIHSLDFFTPDISPVNSSENYMCTVLYSDTDANHSYAVTDVLNNTQLWQLPQRFFFLYFLCQMVTMVWWVVLSHLLYLLRPWKVNKMKPRAGASNSIHSFSVFQHCMKKTIFGFRSDVCPFQRLYCQDFILMYVYTFFLSVFVKYCPAHYTIHCWSLPVLVCGWF